MAGGALLYDSVRWRTARARGLPIHELAAAVRIRPNEFLLRFGRGGERRAAQQQRPPAAPTPETKQVSTPR